MTLILTWAYRYHALGVRESDTLEEAVNLARGLADDGAEALDCIEVWGESEAGQEFHRRFTPDEVWEMAEAIEAERPAGPPPKPIVASVSVKHPEKGWVHFSGYYSLEDAKKDYEAIKARLGDRVKLEES